MQVKQENFTLQIEKMVNDSGQTFTESKRDPNFSEIKNKWW